VGVREPPEVVERSALECLDKGAPGGGMILSFGGGVSPGTPAENIDALVKAAREWSKSATTAAQAKTDEGHGEFGGVG
jgi:uroporphyrinogen-III decarboxylase